MSEATGQITMFEMLGDTATPKIPFEEQKKGRKGWVIEISAILLTKNGFRENMIAVRTHAVQFVRDSEKDKYGRIKQFAERIKPHDGGWYGPYYEVYAARPTWEECVAFARAKYTLPEKVVYYERTGDNREIWEYEDGNKKL